jgi:hypothetical protein
MSGWSGHWSRAFQRINACSIDTLGLSLTTYRRNSPVNNVRGKRADAPTEDRVGDDMPASHACRTPLRRLYVFELEDVSSILEATKLYRLSHV